MEPTSRQRGTGNAARRWRSVFGLSFSPLRRCDIVAALLEPVASGMGVRLFATANLDHIVTLRSNEEFRRAYRMSWLITADGAPVYFYARLMGVPLRERVTGADVMMDILRRWSPARHRPFFVVSSDEVAQRIRRQLERRGFAADAIGIAVPPFDFERNEMFSAALVEDIGRHRPTHLVLGVGAPKSEIWTWRQRHQLGDVYVLAVGAAVEFAVGLKRRSPRWIGRIGLEWLWRFLFEPRRLFWRYFIRSWGIVPAMLADLRSGGRTVCSPSR